MIILEVGYIGLSFAQGSSHTRLHQLADFPSLKVRWDCGLKLNYYFVFRPCSWGYRV